MRRALAAAAVAVVGIAGCGEEDSGPGDGPLRVYLSVPLNGERAAEGKAIAAGAEQALAAAGGRAGEHEIELEVLDDTGGGPRWSQVAAGANARTATEDADAIAFIGELDTNATATSLPITDLAELPQLVLGEISPDVADDVDNEVLLVPAAAGDDPGAAAMTLVLEAIERAGGEGNDRLVVRDELRDAATEAAS